MNQYEIVIHSIELNKLISSQTDCLLPKKERMILKTINGEEFTIFSISDNSVFIFGSIRENHSTFMQNFIVLYKKDDNYEIFNLSVKDESELYHLSIMYFGEGEVDIEDIHWGSDVFLHITAYNIVHESFYLVNCTLRSNNNFFELPDSVSGSSVTPTDDTDW